MIQDTLQRVFTENYPMLIIFTVVIVAIRIAYLIINKKEFVFYRELFLLAFVVYSISLFYVVTFEDNNYGTNNFIPFREITRYEFLSSYFIKNVLGNVILFLPFGYFVSTLIKTRKPYAILLISIITSLTIEITQYLIGRTFDIDDIILNVIGCVLGYLFYLVIYVLEKNIKIFQKNYIKNILVIIMIILLGILYWKTSLWGILR
ncbi:MAG: VanZ family protein [Bacilli bacterium]|nr:VanZ family protein [Bacilli bacterium]